MKLEDIALIARTVTPVVREFVTLQTDALLKQIAVLEQRLIAAEQRAMTPGPQGEQGPPGPAGERGQDGAQGPTGPQGEAGPIGPAGEAGVPGMDGQAGTNGTDGAPGPIGPQGERGEKGIDGLHGKDGQDGITMGVDDLQAVDYDGEHTVTLKFRRGDHEKAFPIKFANVLYRGVFDHTKAYAPGDAVSRGGSLWIAKAETSAIPGTIGADAWMLAVKEGRRGQEGKPGPIGPAGPRGEKGTDGRNGYSG